MATNSDLHVSLPPALLANLDQAARARGVTRVNLVREAVVAYLKALEAERVGREMADYAEEMAAHSGELLRETGAEPARRLKRATKW